jgi:ribosomal-protein-alanine N-acetyltransferase
MLERLHVIFRKYAPADAECISAISRQAPEAAQWSPAGYEEAVRAGQLVLVAETAGAVSGFVVCRFASGEGEILNLAVAPSERRKGVGSRMLAEAAAEAKAKRVERLYLEVRESNGAAISFYRKHGFTKSGLRAHYYRNPTENAVVMTKKLTG